MGFTLGNRDEARFTSVAAAEQEYLIFRIDLCLTILQKRPFQPEALRSAADALTALGYYTDGLELDRRLARLFETDATVRYNLACSFSLTGQADDALRELELSIDLGYNDSVHMKNDPDLTGIQGHPRFRELLHKCRARAGL